MIIPKRTDILTAIAHLSDATYNDVARQVFFYQYSHNTIYRQYIDLIRFSPTESLSLEQIPPLPISLFKKHLIQSGEWTPQEIFTSSGTTGAVPSRHAVRSIEAYIRNTFLGFESQYGSVADYKVLALLPAYLERKGSSLVAMAHAFIDASKYDSSGFYLDDLVSLSNELRRSRVGEEPTLLLGVSFALLNLAEHFPQSLGSYTVVMETGGMKGRRSEMTRAELHQTLKKAFSVRNIHSEYGMTELFSQAYAPADGFFQPASTLRAFTREITDPFTNTDAGKAGLLSLIDLANFDTISFIATEDIGRVHADGSFEVLGRLDGSDVRGCNLLINDV